MVALITGGRGAIGGELTRHYAARGHSIVLIDVSEEGMAKTEKAISGWGVPCFSYCVDTSRRDEVEELRAKVEREAGAIDVLINLAGVGVVGDFLETPIEE